MIISVHTNNINNNHKYIINTNNNTTNNKKKNNNHNNNNNSSNTNLTVGEPAAHEICNVAGLRGAVGNRACRGSLQLHHHYYY